MTETTTSSVFIKPVFQEKKTDAYPQMPDIITIAYVTITTGIMAYAGFFGVYPILLLYAMWLPCFVYKRRIIVKPTKDIHLPIAMISFAVISTVWSDDRALTAKASLESASMVLISIVAARITTLEGFLKGIAVGEILVLGASLISGRHDVDTMSGDYSLVGFFASKNQLGLNAEIGIFAALLLLYARIGIFKKMLYALPVLGIGLVSLYLSHSATSELTLVTTVMVFFGTTILNKIPRTSRKAFLMTAIFFGALLVFAGASLELQKLGFSAVGKDATLTGRTYLWHEGIKFGMQSPVFGVGYAAFWIPGRQLAEALWFKFDIFSRIGFHFHNTFVQTFVDLGFAGLILIVLFFISCCMKSLQFVVKNGTDLLAYYCVGVSFMFLVRALVEVDIGGTFGIGPFLLFAVPVRLAMREPPKPTPEPIASPLLKKPA